MLVDESYRGDGHLFTAAAGQTTFMDTEVLDSLIYLKGASFYVEGTSVLGDYAEFSIVDKNDVLGLFAGLGYTVGVDVLEVVKFERKHYIAPFSDGYGSEVIPGTFAPIVTGLFMRTGYESVGAEDVNMIVRYQWYET
jgi:hypothetical protein